VEIRAAGLKICLKELKHGRVKEVEIRAAGLKICMKELKCGGVKSDK